MEINLTAIDSDSISTVKNSNLTDLYCKIDDDNEKTINLYSNTSYTFIFTSTSIKYYIGFFYNFNYNIDDTLDNNITYYKGINNLSKDDIGNLKSSVIFDLNDMNYNYTWVVYEINTDGHKVFSSGKVKIGYPIVFIKLDIINNKLIHDISFGDTAVSQHLININKNKYLSENNIDIILYENYNYIFEMNDSSNILFFNIYLNSIENYNIITNQKLTYTQLYTENIPYIKKNKYLWSIIKNSQVYKYNGTISLVNININSSNDEKKYDYKFKNIDIYNTLLYNTFIYKENINIKNLNNIINNLLITDSNKLLVINNTNNINISIVLPSTNIYIGLTYNIFIKHNLNILNIYCEDTNIKKDNYDKIKGSIHLINSNNLLCKCILSNTEEISDNYKETNLSENIILKKIRLNNGNIYNGGLDKYGYIKIICSEYINEKNTHIWNIESKLIGNSIPYSNTYLYNAFM